MTTENTKGFVYKQARNIIGVGTIVINDYAKAEREVTDKLTTFSFQVKGAGSSVWFKSLCWNVGANQKFPIIEEEGKAPKMKEVKWQNRNSEKVLNAVPNYIKRKLFLPKNELIECDIELAKVCTKKFDDKKDKDWVQLHFTTDYDFTQAIVRYHRNGLFERYDARVTGQTKFGEYLEHTPQSICTLTKGRVPKKDKVEDLEGIHSGVSLLYTKDSISEVDGQVVINGFVVEKVREKGSSVTEEKVIPHQVVLGDASSEKMKRYAEAYKKQAARNEKTYTCTLFVCQLTNGASAVQVELDEFQKELIEIGILTLEDCIADNSAMGKTSNKVSYVVLRPQKTPAFPVPFLDSLISCVEEPAEDTGFDDIEEFDMDEDNLW